MIGYIRQVAGPDPDAPLLEVADLRVAIGGERVVRPVAGIGFQLRAGETFALLGESGCGKSMTALAIARLLPDGGRIEGGSLRLRGEDLLAHTEARMRAVRGGRIGMVFQEPGTSLNPVMTVFEQIAEVLARHRGLRGAAARAEARRLLDAVGIPDAERRLDDYPFQFSGGMKQRVMIAMALAGEPELLIADEPTTALDVTIQAQVLDLLARLQRERGMGMLLITHDLGVVARMAQRVGVMYAGELVETGERSAFFAAPLHPYSRKLFAALPGGQQRGRALDALAGSVPALDAEIPGCRFSARCPQAFAPCTHESPGWHRRDGQAVRCHLYAEGHNAPVPAAHIAAIDGPGPAHGKAPLLAVRDLQVHFPVRKGIFRRTVGQVRAVDGVSLELRPGRTLALVGESGCGKTTVGKAILQLIPPTAGEVRFDGRDMVGLGAAALAPMRRAMQMVFQDPFASLNPRMRIGEIIEEGMLALGVGGDAGERARRVDQLLDRIGLSPAMRWRYPHEFSGGQRQRIAIARALAVMPRLIVCDEPTSALDVSVQAQLLNLMRELQRELGLAYLFITHNLAVVDYLADEIAVMYLGRIVERGEAGRVLAAPAHPYTRMLLDAVPRIDGVGRQAGPAPAADLPSPLSPPSGCHFHPRCPKADERCRREYPAPGTLPDGRELRCHHPDSA
ncbi:dipeptide ABC transporter ATP-binding protein [Thauera sp. CAU 1555]|uniref:Dipeptide ABC transporter ATP-binding protein n=1 Tax=Thauera sedimentorum TaxID=2767595 RepID=A0ABR9B7U6_9RHOO|nr:dipeptide ABC transporter ATP-binding protein [Thauera sedimentorum]MBC9071509.1 dipeptide ABC transporter ATP-binding protein [Thauera sedimentorum]MBD8502428.1 dipeptide ABC transporter ATP-binding protein [Thauera sedimentorum]